MLADEHWLKTQFKRLRSETDQKKVDAFVTRLESSVQRFNARQDAIPKIALDESLPIAARAEEITAAIRDHQVVVVSGATGSGKSTQLPLIALDAGLGVRGMIGHTQPRRIAARGVAARLASQIGSPLGSDVGFKIRFDDKTSPKSFIKLMTDGILLAETRSDRFLNNYELIIIDEAHERSLNIDFLLGGLKRVLRTRRDLKLIITSATINTKRFADHFTDNEKRPVPIIDVEGRTYPVETRYLPPPAEVETGSQEISDHVVEACRGLIREKDGDILVFFPTEADIRQTSKKLKGMLGGSTIEILPLYARLSTAQQNTIFQPGKARRIVLATNVAESSITVPRISCVVDTGTARISRYAARSKVQRLPIEPVSRASADQRAGRCGRIGPGVCVRLYSEDDYENRSQFTTPEIRRTNLASVILQTLHLRLGPIDEFPFIDPPHPEAIRDGYKTLFEIGAVDDHRRITSEGKRLAKLPVDPRIGKMVFSADRENCLAEVLVIAAALEIQNPKLRPAEKQKAADAAHEKWNHEKSDFLSMLKIWDWYHERKESLSNSKLKRACQQNFLSFMQMRQWQEVYRQLRSMVQREGLKIRTRRNDYGAIHRSLLSGLLSGVAMLSDKHEYTGSGGIKFNLWPGSGVFEEKPTWIIAGEVVETSRRYGRTIASISPDWIEKLASHLIKKRHTDARWSKKKQSVLVSEHVSLFGLPIVAGRPVHWGPIDPESARTVFIEHGLCGDSFQATPDFFIHNQWLNDDLENESAKTRNRDLVVDPFAAQAFYEKHLPNDVFDNRSLLQKIKSDPELDQRLRMTRSDLVPGADSSDTSEMFPDEVQIGSMQIPIDYKFAPGDEKDGATIRLPVAGVGQLDDVQTGWLIPGLLKSRVIDLIRSLPKPIRRLLVPAPETADKVAESIEFGRGNFIDAVAVELSKIANEPVAASEFKLHKLSPHLNVNVEVVDESGEIVAAGRSIAEIRQQLGPEHVSTIVEVEDETWNQDGMQDWTWGDLPEKITITRGGTTLGAFPAIVDQGDSVGLRLADSKTAARSQSRAGLIRLLRIVHRKSIKSQVNWLPDLDQQAVLMSRFVPAKTLRVGIGDLIVRIAFLTGRKLPQTEAQFQELNANAVERISMATQDVAKWLSRLSASMHKAGLAMGDIPGSRGTTKHDIKQQISALTDEGFLGAVPWNWLKEYPRYFDAVVHRIEKTKTLPTEKERELSDQVVVFWQRYEEIADQHKTLGIVDPELEQLRWMIEEFRVSLFAQQLGTAIKVSDLRIEKQLAKIRS